MRLNDSDGAAPNKIEHGSNCGFEPALRIVPTGGRSSRPRAKQKQSEQGANTQADRGVSLEATEGPHLVCSGRLSDPSGSTSPWIGLQGHGDNLGGER